MRQSDKTEIKLTLTEEQAKIVSNACDLYARVRCGQFKEIVWYTLDNDLPTDNFFDRADEAGRLLLEARKKIYPELVGAGHSYGIGKFEDADIAYDVYQLLRVLFGDKRTPFSFRELPKAERIDKK